MKAKKKERRLVSFARGKRAMLVNDRSRMPWPAGAAGAAGAAAEDGGHACAVSET